MSLPQARPRGWMTTFGKDPHAASAGLAPTLGRTMMEPGKRGRSSSTGAAYRAGFLCNTLVGTGPMTLTELVDLDLLPSSGEWSGKITSASPALLSVVISDSTGVAARIAAVDGALAGAVRLSLSSWDDLTVDCTGAGILGAMLVIDKLR